MMQIPLLSVCILYLTLCHPNAGHATLYTLSQDDHHELIERNDISYIDETCSLCLGYLDGRDEVIYSQCEHLFHIDCFKYHYIGSPTYPAPSYYSELTGYYPHARYPKECPVCRKRLNLLIDPVHRKTVSNQNTLEHQQPETQVARIDNTVEFPEKSSPPETALPHPSLVRGQAALEKYKQDKDYQPPEQANKPHLQNAAFQLTFAYQYCQTDKIREQVKPLLAEALAYKADESYACMKRNGDPFNYHRDLSETLFTFMFRPSPPFDSYIPEETLTSAFDDTQKASYSHKLAHCQWMIGEELFQRYKETQSQKQLQRAGMYFGLARYYVNEAEGDLKNKIYTSLKIYTQEHGKIKLSAFKTQHLAGCLPVPTDRKEPHSETPFMHCGCYGNNGRPQFLPIKDSRSVPLLKNPPPFPDSELKDATQHFKSLCIAKHETGTFAEPAGNDYPVCLIYQAKHELNQIFISEHPAGIHLYKAQRLLEQAAQYAGKPTGNEIAYLREKIAALRQKRHTPAI